MAPATGTALILLIAFVLPGFVVVLFQERTFKQAEELSPFDRLLLALYYSLWCYLMLAAVALIAGVDRADVEQLYGRYEPDPAQLVWRGALVVLAPAAVVWFSTLLFRESGVGARLSELVRLNARHQEPTAWDFWFRQGLKSHLRIVFPEGRSVWGYYGDRSFASYAKDGLDLFLEHIYRECEIPDDPDSDDAAGSWFGQAHERNRGGWVKVDGAVCIEVYDFANGKDTAAASAATATERTTGTGGSAAAGESPPGTSDSAARATSAAQEGLSSDE
jgi:hypothetical protein